ncbi:hypothetical protein GCM10027612_38130 [Microbispora bryophytorum subsp. camponoti]
MRLVFAGTPDTALPSLRALLDSPRHEVAAVVTRPDAQSGRGRKMHPSPVAQLAEESGIEVLRPAKAADPEFLARLRAIGPDCCPVVAYGALLPQVALDIPRRGGSTCTSPCCPPGAARRPCSTPCCTATTSPAPRPSAS